MPDYQSELRKQLQFLRNSCALYDAGQIEEAVRIATVIRVLIHDTASSTSLLQLMGAKHIHLATSVPAYEPSTLYVGALTAVRSVLNNPPGGPPSVESRCVPLGEEGLADGRTLRADEWWRENVHQFGDMELSRRAIVLAAANKDGGAHIDDLPMPYARLQNSTAASEVFIDENGDTVFRFPMALMGTPDMGGEPTRNFAYADLRQMATELLCSRAVVELAG